MSNLLFWLPCVCSRATDSRLDRILELALALEYVHGGSGIGVMLHRDIKSVSVKKDVQEFWQFRRVTRCRWFPFAIWMHVRSTPPFSHPETFRRVGVTCASTPPFLCACSTSGGTKQGRGVVLLCACRSFSRCGQVDEGRATSSWFLLVCTSLPFNSSPHL